MYSRNIFFTLGFWIQLSQILDFGFSVHFEPFETPLGERPLVDCLRIA